MARNVEMAVGLHKGHKTTKTVQKPKPSRRKGVRWLDSVILALLFSLSDHQNKPQKHKGKRGKRKKLCLRLFHHIKWHHSLFQFTVHNRPFHGFFKI